MSRFFRQAADSDSESSDSEESLLSSDEDASKPAAPAKPAMSRFLRTANTSDSSSSSSSESESEDEGDSEDEGSAHKEAKPKSRFLRDSDEEESDEEVKRVVKSARDKRLEEMEATGKAMDNALKINDWIAISSGKSLFLVLICAAGRSYACYTNRI
jgi:translation initiation factor 3 subunit C